MSKQVHRRRLYRDRKRGWISGICAGVANNLGVPVFWVRLLAVLPLLTPMMPLVVLAYLVATFRIPLEPDELYESAEEMEFRRSVHSAPSATFGQLRHTMRDLEYRLRRLEAFVTSPQFRIDDGLKEHSRLRSI